MCNLNEIHQYDDAIDQWAARREFELRTRSYERATLGPVERSLRAIERVREAFSTFAPRELRTPYDASRAFACEDPESSWVEMLREETT